MTGKYSLIYADPPWSYGNTISNGAAADHYSTMKLIDIKRLPVWELAAENAVLAMWYTGTHNQEAIELAEAWGFTVRTMKGFTWVKLNQNAELRINKALAEGEVTDFYDFLDLLNAETRMNGGNHTRANTEDLLIATRGAGLERQHAGIKQVVYSPLGAHSEKPWEVRRWICFTAMCRALSCLARRGTGLDHWGNQCATAAVELLPGCAIDVVKTEAA
jgi:N6-adenosine-specific RNA methylase IME4